MLPYCQSCTLSASSPVVSRSSLCHLGCLLVCFLVGSHYVMCLVLYRLTFMSISKSFHNFPSLLLLFFICHLFAVLFSHCIFCPFFIILPFLNDSFTLGVINFSFIHNLHFTTITCKSSL
jgi:uncharacterized membrane protein